MNIFARPAPRGELALCFETVLGSLLRTVEFPVYRSADARDEPSRWAYLSIEFSGDATEVKHPRHPYYFIIPGGRVFILAPTS